MTGVASRPRFAGKVAIVTGAFGGLGQAISAALANEKAGLALIDHVAGPALSHGITVAGSQPLVINADVTDPLSIRQAFEQVVQHFGRLDILVNVAGVVSFGSAAQLPLAEWDRVMDINLRGTFLCCQAAIEHMRRNGYGRIVNIGSVVGKNGGNARPWLNRKEQDVAGNIAYGVSKAGVHALTYFLARELAADGITVNAVAPGPIATAMTTGFPDNLKALIPVGRMGTAQDVAEAVLFLASETSGFITAEILDVNGGMWAD